MIHDTATLYREILESSLDETTKVHVFKVLDGAPTQSELHLVTQLLRQNERHKSVDSRDAPILNPS